MVATFARCFRKDGVRGGVRWCPAVSGAKLARVAKTRRRRATAAEHEACAADLRAASSSLLAVTERLGTALLPRDHDAVARLLWRLEVLRARLDTLAQADGVPPDSATTAVYYPR